MPGTGFAEVMDFKLGSGDVVHITVYGHDDLLTEDRITEQGKISFPLLGEVMLSGLTKGEAERRIAEMLETNDLIKKPSVTVRVVQYHSHQVSVIGMVPKPGTFNIEKPSSLLEVLAQAGGILPDGDDRIMLLRQHDGKGIKLEIDTKAILMQGKLEDNVAVDNADIIYVPPAPLFYVYGEVQHPGVYKMQHNMTVLQALSVGGGLTSRGPDNGIKIIRHVKDGQVQTIDSQLTDIVQQDDVIRVKERLF
jgi:polysaccharide export outer membrane protein